MSDKNNKIHKQQVMWMERYEQVKDYLVEHNRGVWPIVLVICLGITMTAGVVANKNKVEQVETTQTIGETETESGIDVPDVAFEENAHPEINELMTTYYKAMAEGDTETIASLVKPASDIFLIQIGEYSKYVESYPAVNIYTKPGPIENSYMVFAYTEVKMAGYDGNVPGLVTYYVCQDTDGSYYINMEEELSEEVAQYIHTIDLQDDVIDLNNKVSVDFKNLLAEDEKFAAYYVDVDNQITASVSAALEALNSSQQEEETDVETEETASEEVSVTKIVKATDVVNMRSSDSEIADKVGKAQIGDTFTVLEERPNGWTKVDNNGTEVFIKSDFLEVVSETSNEASGDTPAESQETPAVAANSSLGADGKVTAKTTVNVRKSASETAEKLGVIYQGEKLELVMNQADGWCKVKYKGQTGYVKSEFVE